MGVVHGVGKGFQPRLRSDRPTPLRHGHTIDRTPSDLEVTRLKYQTKDIDALTKDIDALLLILQVLYLIQSIFLKILFNAEIFSVQFFA